METEHKIEKPIAESEINTISISDVTRQICASVYKDMNLRDNIFDLIDEPYIAVAESFGLDYKLIGYHILHAKKLEKKYFFTMFFISLIAFLWFSFIFSNLYIGLGTIFYMCIIVLSVIVPLTFFYNKKIDSVLSDLSKKNFKKDFEYSGVKKNVVEDFIRRTSENVIFYSNYSPFVGSGYELSAWSFVVDIDKGKEFLGESINPSEFNEEEFYDNLSIKLQEIKIENLKICDKVYIDGSTIQEKIEFLKNKFDSPICKISSKEISKIIKSNNDSIKHYKNIQVNCWNGDMILNAYFRIQKNNKYLFIENNFLLLPPIKPDYKRIDWKVKETFIEKLWRITKEATASFFASYIFIFSYIGQLMINKRKIIRKHITKTENYDYGVRTSMRELISQHYYNQHFQKLDQERYIKVLEKKMLNIIEEFLNSKNIDTYDFKKRETSILNQGVIVTGGKMSGHNIAVGNNAKVKADGK